MSFFIAATLSALSAVLYLAGERKAFSFVCNFTPELCQNPTWPLYLAAGLIALGLLFRVQRL